jgi:hypothetical protein
MTSSPPASISRANGQQLEKTLLAEPAAFPRVVVAVKALACELPAHRRVPLARWSLRDLRQAVASQRSADLTLYDQMQLPFSSQI